MNNGPPPSNPKGPSKYCSSPKSFFPHDCENVHMGRFDASRFYNFECWKNYTKNISQRLITKPFLVDLVSFKDKGLDFIPLFHYQEWPSLFAIHSSIYPMLVKQFYPNLSFEDNAIKSSSLMLKEGILLSTMKLF